LLIVMVNIFPRRIDDDAYFYSAFWALTLKSC